MRLFQRKKLFNQKIIGKNNTIVNNKTKSNFFLQTFSSLTVKGNNNYIEVNDLNFLDNSSITIIGNNNRVIISGFCGGIVNLNIFTSNSTLQIEEDVGFTGTEINLADSGSKVIIGKSSVIAKDVKIYCTDFHAIIDLDTKQPINQGKEVVIGESCWIGEGAKILKNTHIASNIIVATGSIVTEDLTESYSMYAGIPAKLKKNNVSWTRDSYDNYIKKLTAQV